MRHVFFYVRSMYTFSVRYTIYAIAPSHTVKTTFRRSAAPISKTNSNKKECDNTEFNA